MLSRWTAAGADAALTELGLVKTAYGPADAAKVLQVAKARQLPKAALTAFMGIPKKIPGAFALPSKAQLPAQAAFAQKAVGAMGDYGAEHAASLNNFLSATRKLHQTHPAGALLTRGSATGLIRDAGKQNPIPTVRTWNPPVGPLSPGQHQMLESVVKGHELAETAVKPVDTFRGFGHLSPDVIMREHNALTTMPKGYGPVKQLMQKARYGRESNALSNYLDYGNSERLSRHARKRITEQMERDTPKLQARRQALQEDFVNSHGDSNALLGKIMEASRF